MFAFWNWPFQEPSSRRLRCDPIAENASAVPRFLLRNIISQRVSLVKDRQSYRYCAIGHPIAVQLVRCGAPELAKNTRGFLPASTYC